jgi:hypothetical protein
MHLIIVIALGVFGGLWLFVRYLRWVDGAPERAERRTLARERRIQEERAQDTEFKRRADEYAARIAAHEAFRSPTRAMDCFVTCAVILMVFVTGAAMLMSYSAIH